MTKVMVIKYRGGIGKKLHKSQGTGPHQTHILVTELRYLTLGIEFLLFKIKYDFSCPSTSQNTKVAISGLQPIKYSNKYYILI